MDFCHLRLKVVFIVVSVLVGLPMSAVAQDETTLVPAKTVFSNNYNFSEEMYEAQEGQLETFWRSRMFGESTELTSQSAQIAGFDLFADTKYQLIETLEARAFLRLKFESGRSQSFFGDIEPNNAILVREAAIRYYPFAHSEAKAGIISQDWLNMPLLVYRQAFPGALVKLGVSPFQNTVIGVAAQYSIPTSQTLSAQTVGKEATPTFATQTLFAEYGDSEFRVSGSASLYEYKNLPSFVAFESQKYGNSFSQINGPNNSAFEYPFKGWFTNVNAAYRMNSIFEPRASLGVLKNEQAPETYNDGQIIEAGTNIHLVNHVVSVEYQNFFAESDVVPSYYNSWAYGNTNKKGQGFEFGIQFKKYNFKIRANYIEAKLLNTNSVQQDQKYFYIGVETGYDKI
jgi:hypothetical protein